MNKPLRIAAVIGALGAGSAVLSACDASPYAATVNGHVITVNQLNHQLAGWASNSIWVQQFDAGNSQSQGGNGTTVVGTGGPGTYSSAFAGDILGDIVDVDAIHQHLAATGQAATPDEMVAARAVNEYLRNQYWDHFSTQIRSFLVEQLADEGALAPRPSDTSSLQGPFNEISPYLFSEICVDEASAFSAQAARAIASSGTVNGAEACLDQAAVEQESPAFQVAIQKLTKPGDVSAPIASASGPQVFQVLRLVSRTSPGFDAGVQRVLSAATNQPPAINGILSSAHVKVNPLYGTYSNGQVTPPQLSGST